MGLTRDEVKEKTRLSMDITSMVTSAISVSGSSRKCKDMVLMKTLLTPILDHRSHMEMSLVDGKFIPKYGNHSFYIIMSQSSIMSKNSRMFGQDINVVGRMCKIHNSVNASSIPSDDALFEVFDFKFEGKLTLSEVCHINGTISTENRTIFSYAKIKLPLVCAIRSEKVNCDLIKIHSNKAEEILISQYRMEIIEEHFEEKKVNINSTTFVSSNIEAEIPSTVSTPFLEKIKWPLIASLAAVVFIIFLGLIGICMMKSHATMQPTGGNSIIINNKSTSQNESPVSVNTMVTPTSPPAPSNEGAPPAPRNEGAPPAYHDTVDIEEMLAIPHAERVPEVSKQILEHYEASKKKNSLPQL